MNLKTTILLLLLLGAGAGGWYWLDLHKPAADDSATADFLASALSPTKLTRIEVARGKTPRFILERPASEWSLVGGWPSRQAETNEWLATLTGLHSRFTPIPIVDGNLQPFGLDDDPLIIKVTAGDKTHTLRFGDEPGDSNRFSRSTYVRLDDRPEVIRLGPGVLTALDRPLEYFQQRRLFNVERIAKDEDAKNKVEQLLASSIIVETPTEKYTLAKAGGDWLLHDMSRKKDKAWEPFCSKDHVDPDKLKAVLTGIPDLWAEKFVNRKGRELDEMGLKDPEHVLTVERAGAAPITLLIGKIADTKKRLVIKSMPSQFGPPQPKPMEVVEETRYAKLARHDQVFEIKADKLKDIAPSFEALRDPQLARFKAGDVTRLEISHGGQDLVLVKQKDSDADKWRFKRPIEDDAERKPIEEILDKLAALQARDKEIVDTKDLKSVGLQKPAAEIKLTLEEGKDDKKKSREIVFHLGVKEKEKSKIYVSVEGWPRVNEVGEDLMKLARRPMLAYRHRRVLDLAAANLGKIEIQRDGESFTFEKKDGVWKLTAPVSAEVDAAKVETLAGEVGKLEGVELVSDQPKKDDLDNLYGLAKPRLTAKLFPTDAKKPPHTLTLGHQRDGKQEFYARIDEGPVFTLKKDLRDDLDRASLSYRPLQIWKLDPDAITDIAVQSEKFAFDLKKESHGWKIAQPFSAPASGFEIEQSADALANLKAEKFVAHQSKDLASFGLDKPALTIRLTAKDAKPVTLEIGKAPEGDAKSRYAKASGNDAIILIAEKSFAGLNHDAFDLLDKVLANLNNRSIQRIRYQGAANFALEPMKEQWQVVGSPAPTFTADDAVADDAVRAWGILKAEKYVAYGPKIDWAKYGLDKPATTITVTMKPDEAAKDKKPAEHTLELGSASGDGRFARFDKQDAVVLLGAKMLGRLAQSYLDFVDPRVLKFDLDAVNAIDREMIGADVALTRREDNWLLTKPAMREADNATIGDLLEKLFRLRAKRIAAYPAKDLTPFGLDKPGAIVTLTLEKTKHVIKIGHTVKDSDERFAQIDNQPMVVVLPLELSRHLTASPLYFADRNLVKLAGVDYAELTRGARKAAFSRAGGSWQMVAPIKTQAEDAALDELMRGLQHLRADEIVVEKGANLKLFGLDEPIAHWRLKSGSVEKLHLEIGAVDPVQPGARRFAKMANGEAVFLLSAKVSAQVLEEYRNRKPWPAALDAASVTELSINGPDKAFTLKKRDSGWTVVGDFNAVLEPAKITDTLDALATLKVLRYVADAKADLQLYGLNKPLWTITVKTPAGNRTLLLGRNVENSKRFYASVPGADAVFTIDEADSLRLARPLATYLEAKKK